MRWAHFSRVCRVCQTPVSSGCSDFPGVPEQPEGSVSDTPHILIVDLGSQYTLVIGRTLRELGFRSVILDPKRAGKWIAQHRADLKAVILSGGPSSVYDTDAPQPPTGVLELGLPVLGICYGMQWMAQALGGKVEPAAGHREYGASRITLTGGDYGSWLFLGLPNEQSVWTSHGDTVTVPPPGFRVAARNPENGTAAFFHPEQQLMGVQFHPEVHHTPHGKAMLKNFAQVVAACTPDWRPTALVDAIRETAINSIGDQKAVIGFSGGVDSTTIAAILSPVLGKRILGVTIDAGNLRQNETVEIARHAAAAGLTHAVIERSERFIRAVGVSTDSEEKREAFKHAYRETLTHAAQQFGATTVIQGTLATDRIESGATGGDTIKSHHNVGLTFEGLAQIHPVDHLFKYEIRALAEELKLPESVCHRQPFPGPGLFLRIVGVPVTVELLELVRWADAEVRRILEAHGLYHGLSQLVVSYLGVKTVGVKGDKRKYGGMLMVRAVDTQDFMTAKGVYLPEDVFREINSTLVKHPSIVRAVLDPTDKPPATTEPE